MEESNEVEQSHGCFPKYRQTVAHETNKKEEDYSSSQCVQESEVDSNERRNKLRK